VVRASAAYVLALLLALGALAVGATTAAGGLLVLAALAFSVVWAKWRFDPVRLPVYLLVPFVLVAAVVGGRARAAVGRA
jgi:hypothetical protein